MPFSDLEGAARLVQRIDEIIALVHSWPGSHVHNGIATIRQFNMEELEKFEALDAKIGGLMGAIGLQFPVSARITSGNMNRQRVHGYTRLRVVSGLRADTPEEWKCRLIAVKQAAQEILDVAGDKKSSGKHPDTVDVRDLCAMLADPANRGKTQIGIARILTKEKTGKDKKAQSLMRQARRFPHLWRNADS